MAAVRPVLSVVPYGARVIRRQAVEPGWDSCDGVTSTYGWDPVTVDAEFTGGGSALQVVAHIKGSMQALGWRFQPGSSPGGPWFWHQTLAGGEVASARLLGGPDAQPADWGLQASTPAATHQVKGC